MGIDSCADRFTQIINDVLDRHCCKRVNKSSNKPFKVKNKIWFDEKCRFLHTYYRNVLQSCNKDRNKYNRELSIKTRKEYNVCVVKTRDGT